jgi:hypothetical protein
MRPSMQSPLSSSKAVQRQLKVAHPVSRLRSLGRFLFHINDCPEDLVSRNSTHNSSSKTSRGLGSHNRRDGKNRCFCRAPCPKTDRELPTGGRCPLLRILESFWMTTSFVRSAPLLLRPSAGYRSADSLTRQTIDKQLPKFRSQTRLVIRLDLPSYAPSRTAR